MIKKEYEIASIEKTNSGGYKLGLRKFVYTPPTEEVDRVAEAAKQLVDALASAEGALQLSKESRESFEKMMYKIMKVYMPQEEKDPNPKHDYTLPILESIIFNAKEYGILGSPQVGNTIKVDVSFEVTIIETNPETVDKF